MIISNLKTILANKNISATGLAKMSGVSRTAINQLVNNISGGIQFETVNKICSVLNIGLNDLISFAPFDINIEARNPAFNDKSLYIEFELDVTKYSKDTTLLFLKGTCTYTYFLNVEYKEYNDLPPVFQISFERKGDILHYQELMSTAPIQINTYIIEQLENKLRSAIETVYNDEFDISIPMEFQTLFTDGKVSPVNLYTLLSLIK